jgi:hypothetical protein
LAALTSILGGFHLLCCWIFSRQCRSSLLTRFLRRSRGSRSSAFPLDLLCSLCKLCNIHYVGASNSGKLNNPLPSADPVGSCNDHSSLCTLKAETPPFVLLPTRLGPELLVLSPIRKPILRRRFACPSYPALSQQYLTTVIPCWGRGICCQSWPIGW